MGGIFISLLVFVGIMGSQQVQNDFDKNRVKILADMQAAQQKGDHEQVLSVGEKYRFVSDYEFQAIFQKSKQQLKMRQKDVAETAPDKATKTSEEARLEKIENQFSKWDGSHLAVTKKIKDSMNDPNSFEHVETRYIDRGEFLIVTTKFRGTNAFGGVVTSSTIMKVDLKGNVIEVLAHFP